MSVFFTYILRVGFIDVNRNIYYNRTVLNNLPCYQEQGWSVRSEDMKIKAIWLGVLLMSLLVLDGCIPQNKATEANKAVSSGGQAYAVFKDDVGRQVTLAEKPTKVVTLSTSLLNFVAAVNGNLAGRASVKAAEAAIPDRYKALPEVGPVYNISSEKLVGLQPDLVLANKNQHDKLLPLLDANHIPVLVFSIKTYEDVKRSLRTIGKIYDQEDSAAGKIKEMDAEIAATVAKIPKQKLKIAIIHATPSNVTVELKGSIAGSVAEMLGFTNVAAEAETAGGNQEKTPYSMEALVQQDPQVIFITSMGEAGKIEARLKADVRSNPAWNSLTAVRQDKVYVLPENLFLLNPGLAYPAAVKFMAGVVYPEVFK